MCRANEHDAGGRLYSMITRWMNNDLGHSWRKLAAAVGKVRQDNAGPVVEDRLLKSVGLQPGNFIHYNKKHTLIQVWFKGFRNS